MQCKILLIFETSVAEMPWALRELSMPQRKSGMVPPVLGVLVQAWCEEQSWKLTTGMGGVTIRSV